MAWEVQITGDLQGLRELSRLMTRDDAKVYERDGSYYLESEKFRDLASADAVKSAATEILALLTGCLRLLIGGKAPLQIANIARLRPDGPRDIFVWVNETLELRFTATASIQGIGGSAQRELSAPGLPDWFSLGCRDAAVTKAFRLYGKTPHTWTDLYRLFEVIKDDAGGEKRIVAQGLTTSRAIRRFRHTANSVTAAGDEARHGTEKKKPPAHPMTLGEGKSFMETLLKKWLRWKLQGGMIG